MLSLFSYFINKAYPRKLILIFLLMGSIALGFLFIYSVLFSPDSSYSGWNYLILSMTNSLVCFLELRRIKHDSHI